MSHISSDELELLIKQEKWHVAQDHFEEAWDAAVENGIDAQIIARALVSGALQKLALEINDQAAIELIKEIRQMELNGDFLPTKTIQ